MNKPGHQGSMGAGAGAGAVGLFLLLQLGVMLVAISGESFWIDEFWNAYFVSLESVQRLVDALLAPYGSQTPLHFIYGYIWGQWFPSSELSLRLSNLPLFLMGQAALYWGLRTSPRPLAYTVLFLSAVHPMVWQYANELRPYMMIYAGAEMILAYLLHMHAVQRGEQRASAAAMAVFVFGSAMLFGASLLGAFWVAAACAYVAYVHHHTLGWRSLLGRGTLLLLLALLLFTGLLTAYYLRSLLSGGGASRLASTTPATVLFAAYELLGLSGLGPSRLALRDGGAAALMPYGLALAAATALILAALLTGLREAGRRLGGRRMVLLAALSLLPVAIVLLAGFVMHWRVLGRHLMATLPLLNLLLALGLVKWCEGRAGRAKPWPAALALACLLALVCSALSLRFSERHRKDDYQAATAIASQALASGARVWWAADALGARYYALPGTFDYMGELTNVHKPYVCEDRPGVQEVSGAPGECLGRLKRPDIVIMSKPETFDANGSVTAYLAAANFIAAQELPAFTIWRPSAGNEAFKPNFRTKEKP